MAAAWIGLGLSGISSIFGIAGQNQQNKAQQDYYDKLYKQQQKQNRINERQINRDNKYNDALWEFENSQGQRQADWAKQDARTQYNNLVSQSRYADSIDKAQWDYSNKMLTFDYNNQVRQFAKSEQNYKKQLSFNNLAAAQAYESEQNARMEISIADSFQRQDLAIDQLQDAGAVKARGAAGRSVQKAVQTTLAAYGRNMAKMDESLKSADRQHALNLRSIDLKKLEADLAADAARLLKPMMPPQMPPPQARPLPELNLPMDWVKTPKPPKRISTQVAPVRQTTGGGGFSTASSALAGLGSIATGAYNIYSKK
jgi:hypothetical protein